MKTNQKNKKSIASISIIFIHPKTKQGETIDNQIHPTPKKNKTMPKRVRHALKSIRQNKRRKDRRSKLVAEGSRCQPVGRPRIDVKMSPTDLKRWDRNDKGWVVSKRPKEDEEHVSRTGRSAKVQQRSAEHDRLMDSNAAFAALLPKVVWMLKDDGVGVLVREPRRTKVGLNSYVKPDFELREVLAGRRYGKAVGWAELKTTGVRLRNNDNIADKLRKWDGEMKDRAKKLNLPGVVWYVTKWSGKIKGVRNQFRIYKPPTVAPVGDV